MDQDLNVQNTGTGTGTGTVNVLYLGVGPELVGFLVDLETWIRIYLAMVQNQGEGKTVPGMTVGDGMIEMNAVTTGTGTG
jgi:hypothetical protein